MLELKKTTKYTVVTIPNWDSYQETELKWDSSGTQLGTNKNEKNVNKDTFLPEKQDIEEVDENAKPKSVPKAEQPRVTDVMAIWNAYPNWKATGQKVSPRNPSVKEQLLPKAVQSADLTASILRKRSKYSLEEFEKAIKAYATEVANRAKDDSFYIHRWSLYEFLTYKDVFQRYVTR